MSGAELFQGNGSGGTQKRSKGEFSSYGAPEGEDAEKIVRGIRVRLWHFPGTCAMRLRVPLFELTAVCMLPASVHSHLISHEQAA